jgi:hypothetical protein
MILASGNFAQAIDVDQHVALGDVAPAMVAMERREHRLAEIEFARVACRIVLLAPWRGGSTSSSASAAELATSTAKMNRRVIGAWYWAGAEYLAKPQAYQLRAAVQNRALEISGEIAEARWMLTESQPEWLLGPFLLVMVFWLSLLFASFGLMAPANATVAVTLMICAMSVAGAVFLVVDMAHPYRGLIYISDAALRAALDRLGR